MLLAPWPPLELELTLIPPPLALLVEELVAPLPPAPPDPLELLELVVIGASKSTCAY